MIKILPKQRYLYRCTLRRVVDGDTVYLDIDFGMDSWRKNEKFRLHGFDAWELFRGSYRDKGQQAKWALEEIIRGSPFVRVLTIKDKKGKYGRYLARLYVPWTDTVWKDRDPAYCFDVPEDQNYKVWVDVNAYMALHHSKTTE